MATTEAESSLFVFYKVATVGVGILIVCLYKAATASAIPSCLFFQESLLFVFTRRQQQVQFLVVCFYKATKPNANSVV